MNISKSLRNRIVGFLVLISVILIFVPAMMNNDGQGTPSKDNDGAIAITKDGAVTDEKGQLVSASEHDYSDLLDPVDDLTIKPSKEDPFAIARNNAKDRQYEGDPNGAVLNTPELEAATPTLDYPQDHINVTEETLSSKNNRQNSTTEVLRSSNQNNRPVVNNAPAKPNPPAKPAQNNHNSNAQSALASGSYGAQYGVFSQPAKAEQAVKELKKLGFNPKTHPIYLNGKKMIKVYVYVSRNRTEVLAYVQKCKAKTKTNCFLSEL